MVCEQDEATPGQLRALNVGLVSASLSSVGTLLVVTDSENWWQGLLLAAGLVAALFTVNRSTDRSGLGVLLPGLAVTAVVWLLGVLVAGSSTASFGLAVVGTLVVQRLPRRRRAAALALVAFGAAVIAGTALFRGLSPADVLLNHVLASAVVAVTGIVLVSLVRVVADLVTELERARRREAELAVARERVRFASDLHDIQGHTLHVVKLKVALVRKLLRADPDRVERELDEVYDLVGDTIGRTRELAHAQRRLNLSAELENARNLFEAAGIRVTVDRRGEVDPRVGELLGQVLRETTTNILRHAQAEQVRVTLSERGITITNDGAGREPLAELRGLSALRERVGDRSGELTAERAQGWFLTSAEFPAPGTAP
ncbi:sensor histidine kinase [Nocardiopsis terrae]